MGGVQSDLFSYVAPEAKEKQKTGVIQKDGNWIATLVIDETPFKIISCKDIGFAKSTLEKAIHFKHRGFSGLRIKEMFYRAMLRV